MDLSFLIIAAPFWASVNTFGFRLGLDFAFLAPFVFVLDLALGLAFATLVFGVGFLATFVFEVVGAFFATAVFLPVWAFGRETALSAYARR